MKDRLKAIRKDAGLTQTAFAEMFNINRFTVTAYEAGTRIPSSGMVRAICKEFNVNETWLLTGEGEMHAAITREQEIASLVASVIKDDNLFRRALISVLEQLTAEQMQELEIGLYNEIQRIKDIKK